MAIQTRLNDHHHQSDSTYSDNIPLETIPDTTKPDSDQFNHSSNMADSALLGEVDSNSDYEIDDLLGDDSVINRYYNGKFDRLKRILSLIWNGPDQPRDDPPAKIEWLSRFEDVPTRFRRSIPHGFKVTGLFLYYIFWFALCYSIIQPYLSYPPILTSDPDVSVISLSCSSQYGFWRGKNANCGLDAEDCQLDPNKDIIFRCPALCDRNSWTYSLLPVGDQRIKYRGYFIGGGDKVTQRLHKDQLTDPYRADSYPCGAGVHSGLISPFYGGCARVSFSSGSQNQFSSTKGHYGVSDSIEFLSFFKSSYFFKSLTGQHDDGHFTHCYDPRLTILFINILLGFPIVYLATGTVIFWTVNIVGFWTITLATDPPIVVDAADPEGFASLISLGLERFLPTCCILYVLWHTSTKRTLTIPNDLEYETSPLSRVFYFYPLFWLGILNNVTFDRLPVDRLTLSDLKEQSGALIAVSSIILVIGTCAVIQAYKIWLSGRFKKYLITYSSFVLGLVLVAQLPGLSLRIHHYILAMLLVPGCATRGRTALLFQGILLGLFLSGVARWGFASIAETITSLKRNDPVGKLLPPDFVSYNITSGEIFWQGITDDLLSPIDRVLYEKYSSISILINDIERFVGNQSESMNLRELFQTSADLSQEITQSLKDGFKDAAGNILIYLRIGRKIPGAQVYSDFSNAAILKWPSGDLDLAVPGLT
ncbi:hypothetical protein DFJ63DRAFT_79916 [Scheffersomyces coipomensis]|uniref:uncharacterized protein n=1 Tax=Scheffersomyces coipomensis TaxID=1788519 RepID=UPI00315DBA77